MDYIRAEIFLPDLRQNSSILKENHNRNNVIKVKKKELPGCKPIKDRLTFIMQVRKSNNYSCITQKIRGYSRKTV